MKYIKNKIGILINWPRELDMYKNLIDLMPKNKLEIIANNIKSSEKGREQQNRNLVKLLNHQRKKFKFFSDVYNKEKYAVLLSTGEASSTNISLWSIFKYLLSNSLGKIFETFGIDKVLTFIFGKPFTGVAHRENLGSVWYPEKKLANLTIKFSDGMDLKLKKYPYPSLIRNFDIFFSISKFEYSLIKKKYKNKKCKIIGYSRFENLDKKKKIYNELKKEFNLDNTKKIIFWMPTHIDHKNEVNKNIHGWIEKLSFLNKKYNLIIRPHPYTLSYDLKLVKKLKNKNFKVDTKPNREVGRIIKICDIVLADYGGSVFSTIYLGKPLLLLNMPKDSKYVKELIESDSLDIKIRDKLQCLNFESNQAEIKKKLNNVYQSKYKSKVLDLKKKYFDFKGSKSHINIKDYLLKLLDKKSNYHE